MAADVCVQFGIRIRALRQRRSWRQIDLAEQAGLSENFISELELGQKEACLRTIASLALALQVGIDDLFRKESLD